MCFGFRQHKNLDHDSIRTVFHENYALPSLTDEDFQECRSSLRQSLEIILDENKPYKKRSCDIRKSISNNGL